MLRRTKAKDLVEQAVWHKRAGRLGRAEALCKQLLEEHPRQAPANYLLGEIAFQNQRYPEALHYFLHACDADPKNPTYYLGLGVTQLQLGRHREAAGALRRSVNLRPNYPEALFQLGLALTYIGELTAGYEALDCAVKLKPKRFEVQRCFALILRLRRERERAVKHYNAALQLAPGSMDCWLELATTLRDLGRYVEAEAAATQALAIDPRSPRAIEEVGWAQYGVGLVEKAGNSFTSALGLNPSSTSAQCGLALSQQALGLTDEAIATLRQLFASDKGAHRVYSMLNFLLPYSEHSTTASMRAEARQWDRSCSPVICERHYEYQHHRSTTSRLRIGYISHHFSGHHQALFTTPLFANHDTSRFKIFCYTSNANCDEHTQRLRNCVDVWRDISQLAPAHASDLIRNDDIDILVDLMMHSDNGSLAVLAQRPAPIQCCWLAYPGTTGLSSIDYRITDRYLDSCANDFDGYTERSVVLPETFWCYDPLVVTQEVNALPALTNGCVTFGCVNHWRKLNEKTIELWSRVLLDIRHSRMLLLVPTGLPRARVVRMFERCKVSPDRLMFVEWADRATYMNTYLQIDLGLDTFPYGGHASSLDAFWMGVPVISLVGPTVVGRACRTFAANLGLTELTAATADEFVAKAITMAGHLKELATLRSTLRSRMQKSPLMNGRSFARHMEAAFDLMWHCHTTQARDVRAPILVNH